MSQHKHPPRREGGRVLPLAYYGSKVLRQKAQPVDEVTDEIRQLIDDMVETMWESHGMGLAAPQVGVSLRIFVTAVQDCDEEGEWSYPEPKVYINPELSHPSEEGWEAEEGCLSIPGLKGDVVRPYRIHVRAMNEEGKWFEEELEEWEARCLMHENDHLNGVLYLDRMAPKERRALDVSLKKLKKKYRS